MVSSNDCQWQMAQIGQCWHGSMLCQASSLMESDKAFLPDERCQIAATLQKADLGSCLASTQHL